MSHPDEISAKEGCLGSPEKSSSRWPYGWSKLAAADLPSQYLAGCVSAWRVLRTIAFFFPPKLVDTIDFVFDRKRRNCWPSAPLKTPIGQAVWEGSYPGTLQKVLNIMNK